MMTAGAGADTVAVALTDAAFVFDAALDVAFEDDATFVFDDAGAAAAVAFARGGSGSGAVGAVVVFVLPAAVAMIAGGTKRHMPLIHT